MLSQDDYYFVGSKSNLTSIDLIIHHNKKYLVGKRINNPAKGYYFVPGGVIHKTEKIKQAFKRLTLKELGFEIDQQDFKFLTISQHWYKNNFRDNAYGTHYISLAYQKELSDNEFLKINIYDQHSDSKWLTKEEILIDNTVHPYTKGFFDEKFFDIDSSDIPDSIDTVDKISTM
jgi:colanic acid biosynthesis protein WcaH